MSVPIFFTTLPPLYLCHQGSLRMCWNPTGLTPLPGLPLGSVWSAIRGILRTPRPITPQQTQPFSTHFVQLLAASIQLESSETLAVPLKPSEINILMQLRKQKTIINDVWHSMTIFVQPVIHRREGPFLDPFNITRATVRRNNLALFLWLCWHLKPDLT